MTAPHATPPREFPASFAATRDALHRVAVHVVARARVQATGRFSLRVTAGGFGTPEFGPELSRVRVSGGLLVVERDAMGDASASATAIDGTSLAGLARVAGADLGESLDVGHDTMPIGDRNVPLQVDEDSADALAAWFQFVAATLDRVTATLGPAATPTLVRLWPEHFDIAVEAVPRTGVRVNLGGSPGDGSSAEPYLYVGPWAADRPGGGEYWNAPFGALLTAGGIDGDGDRGFEFFTEGCARLAHG